MPILQQNDAAAVARYTEFVTRSPWGNLMQDRGWAHVKKGWVGEQVYLEQNGTITAAMSIIFAPAVAGRTLAYAPRGPVCDPYDTETIAALMREAAPALKKHRAFLLRFDPETPYTDELIAKYEKLGLRCRARNCGLHDQIQAVDGVAVVKQSVDQALQVAEFFGLERSVFHSASLGAPRRHARRFVIYCDVLNLSRLHNVAAVAVYT